MTRRQLGALGLGDDAVNYRITTGELIRVHAGVYAVGHREPGPIPIAAAVVLACGDDAVLSHDSAAALWGLSRWPTRQEVIAPHQRRHNGIVSHRSTTLTPGEVTVHHGIPVTTPVRTICDIAARRTDDQLLEVVDDARAGAYLGPTALQELIDRCPRLSRLVDPDSGPTRSKLECTASCEISVRSAADWGQADRVGRGWARGSAAPGRGQDPDREWEVSGAGREARGILNES